jgi:hypothetical protein
MSWARIGPPFKTNRPIMRCNGELATQEQLAGPLPTLLFDGWARSAPRQFPTREPAGTEVGALRRAYGAIHPCLRGHPPKRFCMMGRLGNRRNSRRRCRIPSWCGWPRAQRGHPPQGRNGAIRRKRIAWGYPPQGSRSTSLNCACHPDFPLSVKRVEPWGGWPQMIPRSSPPGAPSLLGSGHFE